MNKQTDKALESKIMNLALELSAASKVLTSCSWESDSKLAFTKSMSEALFITSSINEFLELYVTWYKNKE